MKKILSLLLIMLMFASASFASPGLVISEGNLDSITIYAPDGTILDSLSDVGETGMVIRTGEDDASFASDYGVIQLSGNSLLALTSFDIASPSLYLVYGEMNIKMEENLPITVYTPAISVAIPGYGEYAFITNDDAEIFRNYSDNTVSAYDGIRGIYEEVGTMESLDFLAWPRRVGIEKTEEPRIPSSPSLTEPDVEVALPAPVEINIEKEISVPASPSLSEPSLDVQPSPTIIEITKEDGKIVKDITEPVIGEPVIEVSEEATVIEIPTDTEQEVITEEPAEEVTAPVEETAVAVEEPAVTEEETPEETLPAVPAITPPVLEEEESESVFDLKLGGRVYGNQHGEETVSAYIQPSLSIGSFTLTLSIDPFAIVNGIESKSVSDWVGFATDFISEISYYGENALLAIDRTSYLGGDTAGLFTGLDHNYDDAYTALSLNHEFSSEFYSHRIWFDDLSFRRYGDNSGNGGLALTLRTGDSYPMTITLGGAASFNIETLSVDFYPEAALYIPMLWGDFNLGLKASAATAYFNDYTVNPFTENGMLIAASIPFSFDGFTFEAGAAWSTEGMHYGMLGNTLYSPAVGNYVTIRALADYRNEYFGIRAEGWMDYDLDAARVSADNSYVETSAFVNLWGLSFFGGFRTQFSDALGNAEYYGGVGADLGPLDSKIMMNYNKEDGFALTFASSVSMFGKDREKAEEFSGDIPFEAELETGFEYLLTGEETNPVFTVTPKIFIGNENYSIALRAPLRMTYENNDFILGGFNGFESWDFGASESDEGMKIYRAVTDSFALIEGINLGDPSYDIAYLSAERGYRKNGTLFSEYGEDDELSMRFGFNFPNLSLSFYADNAEAPHIVEGGLVFYPGTFGGPSISITVPGEILMASSFKDYALIFYPEFRVSVPFADNYAISIYASGEISTVYQNGEMVDSNMIYDFSAGAMNDYMAGLQFSMDLGNVGFTLDGGIRNNGRLTSALFNELSASRHDTAGTLSEIASRSGNNELKYYAAASVSLDFDFIGVDMTYRVSDLLAYASEPGDYISLSIGVNVNDTVRLYAAFAKDNLTASFKDALPFMDYITTDALFSLGADFTFGRVGFTAELQSSFDNGRSDYINVPGHSAQADVLLSMKARLSF